jgi:hypothetical protein
MCETRCKTGAFKQAQKFGGWYLIELDLYQTKGNKIDAESAFTSDAKVRVSLTEADGSGTKISNNQ